MCCFPLTASSAELKVSCEFLLKRYLNLTRQISHEWVHFGACSHPSFSQPPFSLFLQSSESRSGLLQWTLCSTTSHSYSCCALLLWLQLINSWINSRQWMKALWEEYCFPHSHLVEAKTKVEGGCTHSFLSRGCANCLLESSVLNSSLHLLSSPSPSSVNQILVLLNSTVLYYR